MKSRVIFELPACIVQNLWLKLKPHGVKDAHGTSDDPSLVCWRLPSITNPAATVALKRKRPDAANPRGAYAKHGYSFTGNYAQVTYSKAEHKRIAKDSPFPTCRTFQATHISLIQDGSLPPMDQWQLYQASHLCGYSDCVRPDHLRWERIDVNFARRMCHVFGAFEACPHEPACIHTQQFGKFKNVAVAIVTRPPDEWYVPSLSWRKSSIS